MQPDLDSWLERAQVKIRHQREADVTADELWAAARAVRLGDTRRLGRLVRWRIPGLGPELTFDEMFRRPPFNVLQDGERVLVSGLVGRIWTLRRDYPVLSGPEEFRSWSTSGTVRVLFANWAQEDGERRATLVSETRVEPVDRWGRIGLGAVRPLIASSHGLISSDGIDAALRSVGQSSPSSEQPRARRRRSRGATR
jgi:hypothetical protein